MKYALQPTILLALALALTACNAQRSDEQVAAIPEPPASDQPASDVPPATAPRASAPTSPAAISAAPPPAGMQLARYDGYGDLRFGMTADEAKQAWGGDLNGAPGTGEVCYYLNPAGDRVPSYFAFMIENGKFVRYDVGNDKEIAPGGGRRGMDGDEIRTLYAGRVEEQPHKYVSGGKNLRIRDTDGKGVLIFETDVAGKITAWRVGVPPQVDYVEGCS